MNELIEAARSYWALGILVIPLKGKQPILEWAKWQTEPQTEDEFNSLPWDNADGFAVICGTKTKDGLYIGAVDFDVKNVSPEAVEKGKQALRHLPITLLYHRKTK